MLGLPDHVTTCLFDLDGVLTQTAKVHAAAWKRIFDAFLDGRDGQAAVRRGPRLHRLRRRQAPSGRRAVVPAVARDQAPGGHAGRPARRGDRERARDPQERPRHELLRAAGRRGLRRVGALRARRPRRGAAPRRRVLEQQHGGGAARGGHRGPVRGVVDGVVAERENLRGKPAPDTFLAGARALGVEPAQAAVFEDALAGVEAGRAGALRLRRGRRTASSTPTRCASTAPTSSSTTSPSCSRRMMSGRASRSTRGRSGSPSSTSTTSASASPSSPCPTGTSGCAATSTRASPHGMPGTYLNGLLRDPPPALRRGRLRLPGGRPDDHQRHRRQAHPAARRRRAVRRPLRRARQPRAGARPARRRAAPRGRVAARRPASDVRVRTTRLVSFTHRAVAAIHYEVVSSRSGRRRGSSCSPSSSPTSPSPRSRGPARGRRARRAADGRAARPPRARARACCTSTRTSGLRMAAAMDHVVDGPAGTLTDDRERARPRPAHRHDRARAGPSSCGS